MIKSLGSLYNDFQNNSFLTNISDLLVIEKNDFESFLPKTCKTDILHVIIYQNLSLHILVNLIVFRMKNLDSFLTCKKI